ncbi:hypothetical protein H8356DRAFT_1277749 [Neocallimastix lanati (nom. inval.)]|uniref:EGF-like domain-containing protein n=1 Tax=Neocallimastix californiae TaxID=1754190 RepID=A0A1Y2EPX3_9FUNG|nr:hypothetical protein H8356DRAFT_1277749 [Neocallimastix sp. JGI-2020a]ORY73334.1 hypothetical protein LY90DRAFT_503190 [Neocallimastix californiae]|eukprot:ORY73334.1 hypothetical protein LY90DRAFT_503190 [Neocallimastix californiae]
MGTNIREGKLEILNSNVTNSYFEKGFLYYTNIWETKGIHILNSMYFANNTSKKGTFLYFDDVVGGDIPIISINKGKFINNTALSYGGIFYSNARKDTYINEYIIFSNCTFENNNALLGKISYIYDDEHGANFNNTDPNALEKLKSDNNNFVSNPTRIIFDNYNITDTIVIHSGDNIDQEYSCSIYDDYENKFEINGDIGEAILDDLVMYELSLKGKYDDSLKSKIYGTSKSYCYNNSCKFKNIRVVGEPGDYLLELKIVSYGQFHEFKQNSISMNVKIIECDEEGYINQDIEGINIKSCYYPTCNPNCVNNGKCINVNVCDCSKTYFKGNTCSERYKQERYRYIDVFFKVSSAIIIIITLIVVIGLHHFRNYENIKAASYDFLNIILVGTIINCVYVILLSKEDYRKIDCIIIYLIKNIAFSLIFGSITTKSYRIYYISKMKRRINSKILNSLKFVPTLTLVCVHIIIFLILILLNMIENVKDIDENEKEYVKCSYSQISKLRY